MKTRIVYIVLAALCLTAWSASAQKPMELRDDRFHSDNNGFEFDEAAVRHPERIFIKWGGRQAGPSKWPGMQLDILLPLEEDRSGVANVFFRDRASGEVRMLDSVADNPNYGRRMAMGGGVFEIDTMKHYRQADLFEPGSYDLILLYNNGKYLTRENVVFEGGMQQVVDMTSSVWVMPADGFSRELLKMRKFTDIIGKRIVAKDKDMVPSPHKISGYLFGPRGIALGGLGAIWFRKGDENVGSSAYYDGYVELDVDSASEVYSLDMFLGVPNFTLDAKAGTWIFVVQDRGPVTMVGSVGGE